MSIGSIGIGIGIVYSRIVGGLARFARGWTGNENCFDAVQAAFGGTTSLERVIVNATESDQGSFSVWIYRNSGSTKTFIFDIGDPVTPDVETTRFEIDASGKLDIFLSEFTVGPGWLVFAETTNLALPADQWHHIKVDFANDGSTCLRLKSLNHKTLNLL